MRDAQIRARTESSLKHEVESIFHDLGLTATDAINIFYKQVKLHHGLPFDVRLPNKTTRQALQAAEDDQNIKKFESTDKMFEDLDI